MGKRSFLLLILALVCSLLFNGQRLCASGDEIRIGVVGKVAPFNGSAKPTAADDLMLSLICDSLYELSEATGRILPKLASGWPLFDRKSRTVTVMLSNKLDPTGSGLIRADSIAPGLVSRIPVDSGIKVSFNPLIASLTFIFNDDVSAFWNLFAFAPIWVPGPEGQVIGAGDAPFRISSFENGVCRLESKVEGQRRLSLSGFPNEASMLAAFSAGSLDYIKTGLSKPAASIRGISWQSDAPALISLVLSSKSSLYTDSKARAALLSGIDLPYLILRVLQGNASPAQGIYFKQGAQNLGNSQAGSISGRKYVILVNSTERSSLEMLMALMLESWMEKKGAAINIVLPRSVAEKETLLSAQAFDCLVTAVWLQPAFRGLIKSSYDGAPSPLLIGLHQERPEMALIDKIVYPMSYEELSGASLQLEDFLLSSQMVIPLIRPVVSELYRPEALGMLAPMPGSPLISSLRDIASLQSD